MAGIWEWYLQREELAKTAVSEPELVSAVESVYEFELVYEVELVLRNQPDFHSKDWLLAQRSRGLDL